MTDADARHSLGPDSVRFADKGVAGTGATAVGYGWSSDISKSENFSLLPSLLV